MRKTESLDQICQSGACAPNQTSKLQNIAGIIEQNQQINAIGIEI